MVGSRAPKHVMTCGSRARGGEVISKSYWNKTRAVAAAGTGAKGVGERTSAEAPASLRPQTHRSFLRKFSAKFLKKVLRSVAAKKEKKEEKEKKSIAKFRRKYVCCYIFTYYNGNAEIPDACQKSVY